jgi:hypothetical protein
MTFNWHFTSGGSQRYLLKKRNNDRHVESVLDELLTAPVKTLLKSP